MKKNVSFFLFLGLLLLSLDLASAKKKAKKNDNMNLDLRMDQNSNSNRRQQPGFECDPDLPNLSVGHQNLTQQNWPKFKKSTKLAVLGISDS